MNKAQQQVQEFLERVASDAEFRQKLEGVNKDDRRRFLDEAGFDEVNQTTIELYAPESTTELSDAELEAVAGGATTTWVSVSLAAIALAVA